MALGPNYKLPKNYMAFCPSYNLPKIKKLKKEKRKKIKIKIKPRSTYP